MESDRKVRIGVVGGGFGAGFHWHEEPDCIVEAVADLRPDRRQNLMARYKCEKADESLEEMILDDRIDAIAVFTGVPDHVRHCVAVMNAGKHCICAVPAAMTLEECESVAAKERNDRKYMMAETSYYRPDTITARRLYEDGSFGAIYSEVEYDHPLTGAERDSLWYFEGQRTWRYGFPPMLFPTHSTGFLVGVTGERLVDVSCIGYGDPAKESALADNAYGNPFGNQSALFKTDRGHICRCNVMWGIWAHGERAQWFGPQMAIYSPGCAGQGFTIQSPGQEPVTTMPDYTYMLPEPMRYDTGHGGSHPFLTHEFIQAILDDREPAVNVYEALAMTAPGIVAHQSAFRGGEQLRVPSFDPH